ncbi:MAG: hypothetical protein CMH83_21745 [Nocardioides sp.]|nr:hypothetical protein [Nocardioides sp.]
MCGPGDRRDAPTSARLSAAGATLPLVRMHAASRPADDITAEPHRWTVEADTYDDALAEVRGGVPDGWVLLDVCVDCG